MNDDSLRVVLVSFHLDHLRRDPEQLLAAWPTLVAAAASVARTGATVSVVQACHRDELLRTGGVKFHFVRTAPRLRFTSRGSLAKLVAPGPLVARLRDLKPDVVQAAGLGFPLQTHALTRALPTVPVLVQDHGAAPPTGWRRPIHRWGLSGVSAALFTAREQAEPFFSAGVLRRDLPIFDVLEGSSDFTPGDQNEARRLSGLSGDPCLLWLGRLDGNKDPLTILEAVGLAADDLPDPQLWCCFKDAPLEREVRAKFGADPRLKERVHLLGARPQSEIETLCRAADFLVQGSRREGSGYALIEALACGLTPIVSDIPSFRKITGCGAFGALAPPGDAPAFARNLIEWARRDRASLRIAARRWFEKALSYEAIGRDLRRIYDQVRSAR